MFEKKQKMSSYIGEDRIKNMIREEMRNRDLWNLIFSGKPITESECKDFTERKINNIVPNMIDSAIRKSQQNIEQKIELQSLKSQNEILSKIRDTVEREAKQIFANESGLTVLMNNYSANVNNAMTNHSIEIQKSMNEHEQKINQISNQLIGINELKMKNNIQTTMNELLNSGNQGIVFNHIVNEMKKKNSEEMNMMTSNFEKKVISLQKENDHLKNDILFSNTKTICISMMLSFGMSILGTFIMKNIMK